MNKDFLHKQDADLLTREEQIALIRLGKERWNEWRRKQPECIPDLIQADLRGAILKELDLRRARLNGALLARADLFGSDLSGAQFCGADLSEVRAANVNLAGADLRGTTLRNAFLVKANLNGARLNGADLHEARIKGVTLDRADLSGANLSQTHLNRSTLNEANLSGAKLLEVDIQETDLPDNMLWANQLWSYRRLLEPELPAHDEEEIMVQQHFAVKYQPRVVLKGIGGSVHVRSWNVSEINVRCLRGTAVDQVPEIHQEQETVFITGGTCALEILVPRIPHGIVTFDRSSTDTVTTALSAEHIAGELVIEGTGSVQVRSIENRVSLYAIAGDVEIEHVRHRVALEQIAGSVLVRDAVSVCMDLVRGSVCAEDIQQQFHCGFVSGNCTVQGKGQTQISIASVEGNAHLSGVVSRLDCQVGGNATIHLTVTPGAHARLRTGGTLTVEVPEPANFQISATTDGIIEGAASGGGFATIKYGAFLATLDLVAGANIQLL